MEYEQRKADILEAMAHTERTNCIDESNVELYLEGIMDCLMVCAYYSPVNQHQLLAKNAQLLHMIIGMKRSG